VNPFRHRCLQFEVEAVEQSRLYDVSGIRVRLPRVEDLLIMKAIARRPKDLQDIEGLLDAHPDANVEIVTRWVREFATAVAMSDMIEDWNKLLARRKRN
jgi:predicted nucleotidyltransferase